MKSLKADNMGNIFYSKKGDASVLQFNLLFELLVGIIILVTFLYFSMHPGEFSKTEKELVERELNYILGAEGFAPDNIKVVYPVDYRYSAESEDKRIEVKATGSYKLGNYDFIIEKAKEGGISVQHAQND